MPGSSGGLVSTGLAKGLAVLALGGAGAGGAVAGIEQVLDSTRPESASASGTERTRIEQRASRGPGSPDPRLVAERLRPHDGGRPAARPRRKPRDSESPPNAGPTRSASGTRPEPSRHEPARSHQTASTSGGAGGTRSTGRRSASAPSLRTYPRSQASPTDERSDAHECRNPDDWYPDEADPSRPVPWCSKDEECRNRDDWYPDEGDPSRPLPWCPEEH